MRINTEGDYEYREGLYDDTAALFDENTRSAGIEAACEFSRKIFSALDELERHDDPDLELVADLLSTNERPVRYQPRRVHGRDRDE